MPTDPCVQQQRVDCSCCYRYINFTERHLFQFTLSILDVANTICQPLTDCAEDEWISVQPTLTSDRECLSITECETTQFESAAPASTSDRECDYLSVCGVDDYTIVAHTLSSDRECLPIVRSDLYTTYPSEEQLSPERRRDTHAQFVQLMDDYLHAVALAAGRKHF